MVENELQKDSVTSSVKKLLWDEIDIHKENLGTEDKKDEPVESLYTICTRYGMTLQQFVSKNPDYATYLSERYVADCMADLDKCKDEMTMMAPAEVAQQVRLLQMRISLAEKQRKEVKDAVLYAVTSGKNKDMLLRSMFNRAVYSGDTRAAMYLVDRVDGKPSDDTLYAPSMDGAYNVYQIIHCLFDKQLEVLNSGNGTKLICCSRRAGKTLLLVACCLIEVLRRPNTRVIYIGETLELTEALFDSTVNAIIERCNLRDSKGNRFNWKKLENGSEVMVRGLSNTKDPDNIRGFNSIVIVIDEFFHLKSYLLEYLYTEVLQPMQLDHADNYKFICAGTPPRVRNTFGEFAWRTWNCPKYHWTWEDNPYPIEVEKRRAYIENIIREKGLNASSPFVRREYYGEWCYDDDLLLYPEIHLWNEKEGLPLFNITKVLFGIDYGVSDNDALIGVAWDDEAFRGYVFYEVKFSRLDMNGKETQLSRLKREIKKAWEMAMGFFRSLNFREANKRILWDADDNDQHISDELMADVKATVGNEVIHLNIQNAHKTDRVIMQDKICDLLRTAALLLPEGGPTAKECTSTILKRGPNGEVYSEIDSKVFHPDLLPALRYALWNVLGGLI